MILDKDAKYIQGEKKSFQQMFLEQLDIHGQNKEIGPIFDTV